ncbi:hypothetical protein ACIGO9_31205 [Nocardia asteroides]|uniref:hypothetical protein n=1 Tax=Nocardia asteroides TaxID=1824 RepID=UPI0037CB7561
MRRAIAAIAMTGALSIGTLALGTTAAHASPAPPSPLCALVSYPSVLLLAVIYPDGAPQDSPILAALTDLQSRVC